MDEKPKLKQVGNIFRIFEEIEGIPTFINRDAADLYIESYKDYDIEPFLVPIISFQTRPKDKFDNEIDIINADLPDMFNLVGSLIAVECNGGLIGLFYNQEDATKYKDQRKTNNIQTKLISVLDSTHILYGLCNGVVKNKDIIVQPHKFIDGAYHQRNLQELCQNCTEKYIKLISRG